MHSLLFVEAIVGALMVLFVSHEFKRYRSRIRQFPGPVGLPLIGNLWQLHRQNAPEVYRSWSTRYGDVFQIQLGDVPVLVVNSAKAAKAIFSQESQASASRPTFYTFHQIISQTSGTTLGTSPWTEELRLRRKAMASALNRPAVASYVPHLDAETRLLLRDVLDSGKSGTVAIDPLFAFQRMNLSINMRLQWGIHLEAVTPFSQEIFDVEETVSRSRSTTSNLEDYVPLLRWSPFHKTQKARAAAASARRHRYMATLDAETDTQIAMGSHEACIRANYLTDKASKLSSADLQALNLSFLAGGLDTMTATVQWAFAVLAMRKDLSDKLLSDIRQQHGTDQLLCDAADDQKCQYLVVFIKELLRYYSVVPLSLPRKTIRDINYDGRLIPTNTILFQNVWACNTDPGLWHDPLTFRPERWLEQPEAPLFSFGTGARMCIGYQLAQRELYVLLMRVVSCFELHSEQDIDLRPIEGCADVTDIVVMPKPFRLRFVPRDGAAMEKALQM